MTNQGQIHISINNTRIIMHSVVLQYLAVTSYSRGMFVVDDSKEREGHFCDQFTHRYLSDFCFSRIYDDSPQMQRRFDLKIYLKLLQMRISFTVVSRRKREKLDYRYWYNRCSVHQPPAA